MPSMVFSALSPPNSTPAAAAIRIRFDEAKNEAELIAWPNNWPSSRAISRTAISAIHRRRITVMSVLMTFFSRPSRLSIGS